MYDEPNLDEEVKKNRRFPTARTRSPRSTRTARYERKTSGFGGSHRRRNKHWGW